MCEQNVAEIEGREILEQNEISLGHRKRVATPGSRLPE